jgi:alcohol dehydrogenase (cytochrome c)/quinohemoprotein ethanol dehydrogenase
MRKIVGLCLNLGLGLALAACANNGSEGGVDTARLLAANETPSEWLAVGRTYDEQRYSPLDLINRDNVSDLGLAWYADLDTARGQEATPLMIDGVLYVSTAWSMVKAFDGRTGELLWSFDPEVPRSRVVMACCDAVNRGVAAWGDKLYVGTLDGRLIAIDRATGEQAWSVVTVDQEQPYTITGAPRIIDGRVIIGNGGAEFGVRGYITAYDADNGEQLWRFYTVPDNPANGDQPEYLQTAAETWHGEWWELGGGGTVWDSMAYDPELNLLYIGVGNGSPWNQAYRSPAPEGEDVNNDNLYLSSIVAIRPDSGEYVWHFQETPGETWDFTATQHIILADLEIDGETRHVLMQAPKNGFFYVIDRETGEFISANNYVPMNWATGVDPETGRPIENPEARYDRTGQPFISFPGAGGGHNWHPMAYDPNSGLVFIPANEAAFPYFPEANWAASLMGFNVGIDMAAGAMPADAAVRAGAMDTTRGALIAWDPVAQEERWRVQYQGPWNGGVLATGGGLVFQGSAAANFAAFSTEDGSQLWSMPVQTGVVAAPMTYELDGEQYVAVLAGWGGVWSMAPGLLASTSGVIPNVSRLLVFKLGGTAELPETLPYEQLPLDPPTQRGTPEQIAQGNYLYGRYCGACHGDAAISGVIVPDLRRSGALENADTWNSVVIDGALASRGMVSFSRVLSPEQAQAIRHYIIARAHEDRDLEAAGG